MKIAAAAITAHGWSAWRQRHLHDYTPTAVRLWLLLVAGGAGALLVSAAALWQMPADDGWQAAIGLA